MVVWGGLPVFEDQLEAEGTDGDVGLSADAIAQQCTVLACENSAVVAGRGQGEIGVVGAQAAGGGNEDGGGF